MPSARNSVASCFSPSIVPIDGFTVLYCAHGHEISQGLVAALRAMGVDARYLDGGIDAWKAAGEPADVVRG